MALVKNDVLPDRGVAVSGRARLFRLLSKTAQHPHIGLLVDAAHCKIDMSITADDPVVCRCVSFRTPEHVRKEWASEHGLPLFTSDQYTHAMDAVCKRLGVSEGELGRLHSQGPVKQHLLIVGEEMCLVGSCLCGFLLV